MITKNRIMTRTEATEYIKNNPGEYLKPDKKGTGYICPICGSGSGNNGTGLAVTADKKRFTCFAGGCFKDGSSIIDIIALDHGIDPDGNPGEAFKKAYEVYGIEINAVEPIRGVKSVEGTQTPKTKENAQNQPVGAKNDKDYISYYKKCKEQLENSPEAMEYIASRGISRETGKKRSLGYDPKWLHPNPRDPAKPGYPSKRIIIPNTTGKYTARATDPNINKDYRVMKVGGLELYNAETLQQEKPLFITESEWEALSVIEVGGQAMALGSTNNVKKFIERLKADPPKAEYLIISLDNDKYGHKATAEIVEYLQTTDILFLPVIFTGQCKDINEALQADRNAVKRAVMELSKGYEYAKQYIKQHEPIKEIKEDIKAEIAATQEEPATHDLKKYTVSNYFADGQIYRELENFQKYKDRKTGFENLDKVTGGLYPGLYVIGAISSLGKTTFIHQMADNLAMAGDHVLFFSLEQNQLEMVTKSISRIMAKKNIFTAMSAIELKKQPLSIEALEAIEEYGKIGDRVSIIPCNFNTNISYIVSYTKEYIKKHNVKPVVIVDYLQIIPPADLRQSDKEKIDNTVRGLKKLQSDNNLVVMVVSSINRANYLQPIDFESFKESGGIEYTADVLWGLQLECLNDDLFNHQNKIKEKREAIKKAKQANPRKIELVCLKNRYGVSNYSCNFNYNPCYDLFTPETGYYKPQPPINAESGKRPKR